MKEFVSNSSDPAQTFSQSDRTRSPVISFSVFRLVAAPLRSATRTAAVIPPSINTTRIARCPGHLLHFNPYSMRPSFEI